MSTPLWVHYKNDLCFGSADPDGNIDTFNRASIQIWKNFSAHGTGYTGEHDKDGDHCSDILSLPGVWAVEDGTFTGNGADDRNISLTDTGLDIKYIRVWEASTAYTFFRTETMSGDLTMSTEGKTYADYIQSVATTGQFQVGTLLNVNLRVYYYVCYGIS